jgi:hypothetical protein
MTLLTQPDVITVLWLNRAHPAAQADTADLCRMHNRVIDATVGMPEDGPRVLWAQPRPEMLVIRAPEPVTAARLPAAYATSVQHRPWMVPDRPGLWMMQAVLNPGRNTNIDRPTLNHPDRRRKAGPPLLYADPDDQAGWLSRRLPSASLRDFVTTGTQTARGRHRTGRTVTVRRVACQAVWQIPHPEQLTDRLRAGIGLDKTWGCGLTVWAPTEQTR